MKVNRINDRQNYQRMPLISAVRNQRRANPLSCGAFGQRAALSFGTFLFAVEKKSTLA
jgi:hypothetical protein